MGNFHDFCFYFYNEDKKKLRKKTLFGYDNTSYFYEVICIKDLGEVEKNLLFSLKSLPYTQRMLLLIENISY